MKKIFTLFAVIAIAALANVATAADEKNVIVLPEGYSLFEGTAANINNVDASFRDEPMIVVVKGKGINTEGVVEATSIVKRADGSISLVGPKTDEAVHIAKQ